MSLMSRSNDGGKSHEIEVSTEGGERRERTKTLTIQSGKNFSFPFPSSLTPSKMLQNVEGKKCKE